MPGVTREELTRLAEPFGDEDIEWRVGQSGKSSGKWWIRALAYLTNRAIQQRLDEVVGPENWRNEYLPLPNADHTAGCQCGLSIRIDGEWVTKWDGANNTGTEPIKGGMSDAMKRAAVQWGMGRHLYGLGANWGTVVDRGKGQLKAKVKDRTGAEEWVDWNPPKLSEIKPRKLYGTQPEDIRDSQSFRDEAVREIEAAKSTRKLDTVAKGVQGLADRGELTAEHFNEIKARVVAKRASLASGGDGQTQLLDTKAAPEGVGV